MARAYRTYSVRTGDLIVVPDVLASKRSMLGLSPRPSNKVRIGIRPSIITEDNQCRANTLQLGIELTPNSELGSDKPFLPTPLADIRPEAQAYFKKHRLLRSDQTSVHPWHIYEWSRKAARDHRGFKVVARENGYGGMILLPLDVDELRNLPIAIKTQEAADRRALDDDYARARAELAKPEIQAALANNEARRSQRAQAATGESTKILAAMARSSSETSRGERAGTPQRRQSSGYTSTTSQKTAAYRQASRILRKKSKA